MALSQKHQGKVLVPWFNSDEWVNVYNLIYSKNSKTEDKYEALKVLHIWKKRMPRLFIGVEATLIILEALLLEENIPENVKRNYCATAVMRFLNICTANTETQGTFYFAAKRNKLPDWLVDMRHSLAHSHDVPTTLTLIFALQYCLQWLKSEYWDVQKPELRDFVIVISKSNAELRSVVDIYCDLVVSSLSSVKVTIEQRKKLKELHLKIPKNTPKAEIQKVLLAKLGGMKFTGRKIVNAIVENASIFTPPPDLFKTTDTLPSEFVRIWENLMQYLHENKFLILLIKRLNQKITDDDTTDTLKNISSMWLNEIFKGLAREKMLFENAPLDEANLEFSSTELNLNFYANDLDIYKELVEFKDEIVETPNVFTYIFLRNLLRICGSDNVGNAKLEFAVKQYTMVKLNKLPLVTDKLYTTEELKEILQAESSEFVEPIDVPQATPDAEMSEENVPTSEKRWQIVTNTSIFEGCPLGILPYEIRNRNAMFMF